MQDALPAFVLRSEDVPRIPMNESPSTLPHETAPGPLTDEQLMLQFSKGSTSAFAELLEAGPTMLVAALIFLAPAWLLWRRYRRAAVSISA
jgi:hypothetical protein